MIDGKQGSRLTAIRKKKYKNVIAAVAAMNRSGFKIKKDQFYRLEKGQIPTQNQLVALCDFFDVTPEWLLFGVDDGRLDKLNARHREIVDGLIDEFIAGYALPHPSPPPLTPDQEKQ